MCCKNNKILYKFAVAPFAGAWIEIVISYGCILMKISSHPSWDDGNDFLSHIDMLMYEDKKQNTKL